MYTHQCIDRKCGGDCVINKYSLQQNIVIRVNIFYFCYLHDKESDLSRRKDCIKSTPGQQFNAVRISGFSQQRNQQPNQHARLD